MTLEVLKERANDGTLSFWDIVDFYILTENHNFISDLKRVKDRYTVCGPECHQRCTESQCILGWGKYKILAYQEFEELKYDCNEK